MVGIIAAAFMGIHICTGVFVGISGVVMQLDSIIAPFDNLDYFLQRLPMECAGGWDYFVPIHFG